MFCTCKHFERIGLPCVHQVAVASLCHDNPDTTTTDKPCFRSFTHYDISVRWWISYMYYAYRKTTPSAIVHQFHNLAIQHMNGPTVRCPISLSLQVEEAIKILPARYRLKNYPKDAVTSSQLMESVMSQRRIHLSEPTNDEGEGEAIFNHMNKELFDYSGGHLHNIFNYSIKNSNLNFPQREKRVMARNSLKQLFEECCAEADSKEPDVGVNELERLLKSYLTTCIRNATTPVSTLDRSPCTLGSAKSQQKHMVGRNVPMTHRRYNGKVHRVFNTHHYM
jgi:hypothetical protein